MRIKLLYIGKTDDKNLEALLEKFISRLGRYVKFETECIPDLKNTKGKSVKEQKKLEGQSILKRLDNSDHVVLLDENGKHFDSVGFAGFLQKKMNAGTRNLVLVIGGPYGFSEEVYKEAREKLSLSKMTFSHQMVRLFAVEQIYRAFTILHNEPYHHQ